MENEQNWKIGIVTVFYNSEPVLYDFFETLNKQTFKNFILYIVDNNSKDNSVAKSKELADKVDFECRWLLQSENLGVAKGNNIGIKVALADNCDYILLSNNDIVLESHCIQKLLDGMLEMNATMAVPKIYFWNMNKVIWMAGGGFLWLQCTTYHRGEGQIDKGQYDRSQYIEYAPTCFMLIDSSVFCKVGFMDEKYFVYYDDTDFVWRATKKMKEKLVYIYNTSLWHKVSFCTGGGFSDFSLRYMNRNRIYFTLKNLSKFRLLFFVLYLIAHYILRDLFLFNYSQRKLVLNGYKEGVKLYLSNTKIK